MMARSTKKNIATGSVKHCEIMEITSYVSLNRWMLKLVGLYPKNWMRCFTVAFFMLLMVVPQILQIYYSRELDVILETSSVLLTILLSLLKMIVWIVKRNEINDLIMYMFSDCWNLAKSEEKTAPYFLEYAIFAQKFTRWNTFLIVISLLLFYSLPLIQIFISETKNSFNDKKNLLFPGVYPEEWTEFPFYQVLLMSQILATSSCGAVILAIDTLVATVLLHTCGHLKIIQKNLHSLSDDVNHMVELIHDQDREKSLKSFMKKKLHICIKYHQLILRFSDTVERSFSPIMLCQVLASNMIICLVGLQISTTLTDQSKVLKYLSYFIVSLFQLVLFCLPGDVLINQSLAVGDAIYAINWYEFPKFLRNDVKLIIVRSQKPIKITAGKFSIMCLEHFAYILSTAMSYFTVLRSLS